MVTVETKNYPVATIRPYIQRYAKIRKKMNASQIANCLAAFATVTLEKNDGTKVRLTSANLRSVLVDYTNELKNEEVKKSLRTEAKKNAARLDEFKENAPKETTTTSAAPQTTTAAPKAAPKKKAEPVVEEKKDEEVEQTTATPQEDPEDEDTFDSTPFYDKDDE
jgi:hypothetical protein